MSFENLIFSFAAECVPATFVVFFVALIYDWFRQMMFSTR